MTATAGDADIAAIGALLGDRGRCRMLIALGDGRALPAGLLAAEAGVTPATASSHLAKLVDAGLLSVQRHGRFRYYSLAGPVVGDLIETLMALAPAEPIRSLRQGTKANALRRARTCYDHLAGRLGVAVMAAMLERGLLAGGDGRFDAERADRDGPRGYGRDVDYRLTRAGLGWLASLGVELPPRRQAVRYCVDWSEQRHHLAGGIGHGLLARLLELEWLRRAPGSRAVLITPPGQAGLSDALGIELS